MFYQSLPQVKTLNSILELAKSNARFKIVANHAETADEDMKTDIALYFTNDKRSAAAYTHNFTTEQRREKPDVARCAWAFMLAAMEVKPNHGEAGYVFNQASGSGDDSFLHQTLKGDAARAQHAKYAAQILLRQHRTHAITFYWSGSCVRAFRWDRAGCIATEPIDLLENPWDFYDLIYCLGKSDKQVWGFDDTVELATPREIAQLSAHEPETAYLRACRDSILESQLFYPVYKVSMSYSLELSLFANLLSG